MVDKESSKNVKGENVHGVKLISLFGFVVLQIVLPCWCKLFCSVAVAKRLAAQSER